MRFYAMRFLRYRKNAVGEGAFFFPHRRVGYAPPFSRYLKNAEGAEGFFRPPPTAARVKPWHCL